MKYRLGSACLYVIGAILVLGALAPVHNHGISGAFFLGASFGKLVLVLLAVAAFLGGYRMGKKAKLKAISN